jgi:hypothetical protein
MAVDIQKLLDEIKRDVKNVHGAMTPVGAINIKGKRINVEYVIKKWEEYLKNKGVDYIMTMERDGIALYLLEYISDDIEKVDIELKNIAVINGKIYKVYTYWIMYVSCDYGMWLDLPPGISEEEVYK